jgi:hypothetical protein
VFFNLKRPEQYKDKAEEWTQLARRAIQSGISCYFTFAFTIRIFEENQAVVHIRFTTIDQYFYTTTSKDPVKFVKKEILPWIQQNEQHV